MKKYFVAAIISLIYIPFVTVVAELYAPLKDFLKNTFWHHWLGKGVILVIIFVLVALVIPRAKEENMRSDEKYFIAITSITVLGALSVFLFFVFEYFKHL